MSKTWPSRDGRKHTYSTEAETGRQSPGPPRLATRASGAQCVTALHVSVNDQENTETVHGGGWGEATNTCERIGDFTNVESHTGGRLTWRHGDRSPNKVKQVLIRPSVQVRNRPQKELGGEVSQVWMEPWVERCRRQLPTIVYVNGTPSPDLRYSPLATSHIPWLLTSWHCFCKQTREPAYIEKVWPVVICKVLPHSTPQSDDTSRHLHNTELASVLEMNNQSQCLRGKSFH